MPVDRTYYINRYFQNAKIANTSQLEEFITQNGLITDQEVLRFCIDGAYRFDVIGLFTSATLLTHSEDYSFDIDSVGVSFRLFSKAPSFRLKV